MHNQRERGIALAATLIVLLVLTLAAIITLSRSRVNTKMSGYSSEEKTLVSVAESGLGRAKLKLKKHLESNPDFDALLAATGHLIPETDVGQGKVYVDIKNNHDFPSHPDPGGVSDDTDQIAVLTAVAEGKRGQKLKVQAVVGRPPKIQPPSAPESTGAISVCGTYSQVTITNGAVVSGFDWNVPAVFDCGASCEGTKIDPPSSSGPGADSVVYSDQTSWGTRFSPSGGTLEHPATNMDDKYDPSFPCTGWKNLSDQLASLSDNIKNVEVVKTDDISSSVQWGTRSSPQVTIVAPKGGTLTLSGRADGAGVLVLTGALSIPAGGYLHYEGIVIVTGNRAALTVQGGSGDLFGYVVIMPSEDDAQEEVLLDGPFKIKHSKDAVGSAENALLGGTSADAGLITMAWKIIR